MVTLNVNGVRREVQAPDDTPLLYVLRNDLELIGPQFGCGLAQCGACSVLVDGKEVALLRHAGRERRRPGDHHARRSARAVGQAKGPLGGRSEEHASPGAASLDRGADSAVRLLPERHDDQGDRTARKQSQPDRGANQRGLHHVRAVAESVPLRNLRRDHRSRTTCRHDHGEGEVSDGNHERKTSQCFRTDAVAPSIRQSGRRPRRGLQLRWRRTSEGRYREARRVRRTRSIPRFPVPGSRFIPTTRS